MKILIILTGLFTISYCNVSDAEVERYTQDCVENLKLVGFKYDIPYVNYIYAKGFNYSDSCSSFELSMNSTLNGLWLQNYGKNEESLGTSLLSVADIKAYIMDFYETNRADKFNVPNDLPKLLTPEEFCRKLKNEIRKSSIFGCIVSMLKINIEKCSIDIQAVKWYIDNAFINLASSYELSTTRHPTGVNDIAQIVGKWKLHPQKYYNYHMDLGIQYSNHMPELKIETWCTTYIKNILIKKSNPTMNAQIQAAQQASCT